MPQPVNKIFPQRLAVQIFAMSIDPESPIWAPDLHIVRFACHRRNEFFTRAGPKHLAFARGLETAVELLVERVVGDVWASAAARGHANRQFRRESMRDISAATEITIAISSHDAGGTITNTKAGLALRGPHAATP